MDFLLAATPFISSPVRAFSICSMLVHGFVERLNEQLLAVLLAGSVGSDRAGEPLIALVA